MLMATDSVTMLTTMTTVMVSKTLMIQIVMVTELLMQQMHSLTTTTNGLTQTPT